MTDSVLSYIPSSEGKQSYRLQCSLSLEEAAEIESHLSDPTLPFQGNTSLLIRTFVRAGLIQLHDEANTSDSFISAIKPMLGSEMLRWSASKCDEFAIACTDHLSLANESDTSMAEDVVLDVAEVITSAKHPSVKAMIKRALVRRGFIQAMAKLREAVLQEGGVVYWIDNVEAEVFA